MQTGPIGAAPGAVTLDHARSWGKGSSKGILVGQKDRFSGLGDRVSAGGIVLR